MDFTKYGQPVPRPDPNRPDGSELPTLAMGAKVPLTVPFCLHFHRYIFPVQ